MNPEERRFHDALVNRGFDVLRRGWPDFLVMRKGWASGFAVEYKSETDRVRPEQAKMHNALARFGIMTYIAGPDSSGLLKKRGKALLMPEDFDALRQRCDQLERDLAIANNRATELTRLVSALPVLLDEPSQDQRDSRLLGQAERGDINSQRELEQKRLADALGEIIGEPAVQRSSDQPATKKQISVLAHLGINKPASKFWSRKTASALIASKMAEDE